MDIEPTGLQQRITAGKPLLLAEISPPQGAIPPRCASWPAAAPGKFHAVGVSDNRDHVAMSALAAAALVAAEGVEPILHVVTRDRNRIALVSDALGAQALGIRNLLVHQRHARDARTVPRGEERFRRRSRPVARHVQPIWPQNGALVGEKGIAGAGPFCLGGVASPNADPLELQVLRMAKKVGNGARFLDHPPVFDLERFAAWWQEVTRHGLHEKAAIVAGIQPLADGQKAAELAAKRPRPRIPEAVLGAAGRRHRSLRRSVPPASPSPWRRSSG